MVNDNEEFPMLDDDESFQPSVRGFAPEQMVTCEACLRANPPTRTSCLYCAAALPTTAESEQLRRPTLRRLEKWEQGFNCILMPEKTEPLSDEAFREAADLLRLSAVDLKRIIDAGDPLPLARAATEDDAALIKSKLDLLKLGVMIVSDHDLALDAHAPKRIRAMELTDASLVAHPLGGGGELRVAWTEILLFVGGRHLLRRIEVQERRGRGSENEIADTRELSSDESLLDIYSTARNDGGLRIASANFDFSCLGERKRLLAAENFTTLVESLCERAPQAERDDSYQRVRHALHAAWPLEQHTESRGFRRERPGKYSVESATTSDNESQFTRYSRLRHYLKLRSAGLKR
ncbi:MAG: hypothetical protein WCF57_11630 [Pyrinomonadaceae bacterium]